MKKWLKEIVVNPFTYGLFYLGAIVASDSYLAERAQEIHDKYTIPISRDQIEMVFKEEQKKIGLENSLINLNLEGIKENGNHRGHTVKSENGYKVTLYEPYTDVTARHELSHVKDLEEGRVYYPASGINPLPLISEWRAQNYSIEEIESK
ncbi:MAG: hypothetical protein AABX03_03115 [Nanoarchaeota archaeon]|mgnify:CR=1 FL=1